MKKFKFRFEKLLEYKKSIEDERKNELAFHISRFNRIQINIEENHRKKDQIIESIKSRFSDPTYVTLAQHSLQGIYQSFINGNRELQKIQTQIDAARERFLEARKERKIFEKLKEKAYEKHKQEEKKEIQKFLNETGAQIWRQGNLKEYEWT
jgi:flagellar FliJ protein